MFSEFLIRKVVNNIKSVNKSLFLFLFGFMMYITLEVLYRGYSFWLMGVCGGFTILILDQINNRISWDFDLLLQGCIGSCIITTFELIIGELFLHGVLPVMWDYSNSFMNYKGIICLPFSLLWIGASILAIFCADAINYYVFNELPIPYYKIFGKTVLRFRGK